ncbi:glycoside hydrolase family 2 protein [Piedraia hortae CBS 480.64]|uniref:Beta-mannosidase B n=1 Tax=Piedraia hortae CBS 480.64 TaxID=1314780 RepID=A0A6A7C5V9_9PEZI|nr:glycoside hydrolase family 2 protein [Piedraia hortae CBS 480.64]
MEVFKLTKRWEFKQTNTSTWLPVAQVPTNVHQDLIANNIIKDPFLDLNEQDCQWVGKVSWTYRLKFPGQKGSNKHTILAFDGLDTFATVTLNNHTILTSSNMFIPHRVDITETLIPGTNTLAITFRPALLEGRKLLTTHPSHKYICSNGEPSRLPVRKAQYHWGWDWGPVLLTCGPYREIRLESYCTRISDLTMSYILAPSFTSVSGTLTARIEDPPAGANVTFTATFETERVFHATVPVIKGEASLQFFVPEVRVWMPHTYGMPHLYTIIATLQPVHHEVRLRTGFREVELVQRPLRSGKTFLLRINGVDIFCGGSNLIPTPRSDPTDLLRQCVEGNQTSLRIWGGGVYPPDEFYACADELGVVILQDFMFACGNYPTYPAFRQSVAEEVESQVGRLTPHPSVCFWMGNNECYDLIREYGLEYDWEDKNPRGWLKTTFPSRWLFEHLIPRAVMGPYSPASPFTPQGKPPNDPNAGDMHYWGIWHGGKRIDEPGGGRFVSEFGMQAFPCPETIERFVTDPRERHPQSKVLDAHNKATGHMTKLAGYVAENLPLSGGEWWYLTQLLQAETMRFKLSEWRHDWGRRGCGGALVWMLNDSWPAVSWSLVDCYGVKKMSFYAVKRAFGRVVVVVRMLEGGVRCWVTTYALGGVDVTVQVRAVGIHSGEVVWAWKGDVRLTPNGTTDVDLAHGPQGGDFVLAATCWVEGRVVSRDVEWPVPLRYVHDIGRERGVKVRVNGERVVITAEKPTKGFNFEEREGVQWSDNAFDLVPEVEYTVERKGDGEVKWTFLGKEVGKC